MLDPQIAAHFDQIRSAGDAPIWELPLAEVRAEMDAVAPSLFGPGDRVAAVEDADADGVPVRVYRPSLGELPALVFFHGGGWVVGSLTSHDLLCRALAARGGFVVVSVGYRLAPEHPFPAAIDDAWTATGWAARELGRIAVAGDSAGGQLAASVALRARAAGLPLALQALVYPVTDHSFETASYRDHGDSVSLTQETMRWFWDRYLEGAGPGAVEDHSPLRAADLAGLPPALVLTAEHDPLRDEGEAYAERLRAAGVPVDLHRYEGMPHGFFRWPAVTDRANQAIRQVAAAVQQAFA